MLSNKPVFITDVRDRISLFKRALSYYSKQLENSNNENLNELIQEDLKVDISEVALVSRNISNMVEFAKINGVNTKKIVCQSLECYIKGLEKESKALEETIGIRPNFENLENEIKLASEALEDISNL